VRRIEDAVWNDLQYIRVNGAVVGGSSACCSPCFRGCYSGLNRLRRRHNPRSTAAPYLQNAGKISRSPVSAPPQMNRLPNHLLDERTWKTSAATRGSRRRRGRPGMRERRRPSAPGAAKKTTRSAGVRNRGTAIRYRVTAYARMMAAKVTTRGRFPYQDGSVCTPFCLSSPTCRCAPEVDARGVARRGSRQSPRTSSTRGPARS